MRDTIITIAGFIQDLLSGRKIPPQLDQAIAAAASAHGAARRGLAIAVAEETRESDRRASIAMKANDLEERAVQAIRAGRDDLALMAAETIANLRSEIEASEQASARFAAEVALARTEVGAQRRRLADLDRGRRLASIGRALNATAPHAELDRFAEAEAVLAKLNAENADARAVRDEIAPPSERVTERLANEGFGKALTISAADVMVRLRTVAAVPPRIETAQQS